MAILKLKSRRVPEPNQSPFDINVTKAREVKRRLDALNNDPLAGKLSAKAFLAETLAVAPPADMKRVSKLRASLEGTSPSFVYSRATRHRMTAALRGNFRSPPKPQDLGKLLRWLSNEATTQELTKASFSNVDLLGVAVQVASENHPEIFGEHESTAEVEKERAQLNKQKQELDAKCFATLSVEDLDIGEPDAQGHSKVTFRLSNGQVPLGPKDNAIERLLNHLGN